MATNIIDPAVPSAQDPSITVVEPPVSSPCTRARFEFESNGRGNGGSKILMIEWEEDESTREIPGTWAVEWEGMPPSRSSSMEAEELNESETSSVSAKTSTSEELNTINAPTQRSPTHQRYFLIGPKRSIPPIVTITLKPLDAATKPVTRRTNPLPAIFPKPLMGEDHGRLGVLHTQWAKMRLVSLDREIETEVRYSPEGVALHMALSERHWIVNKFGVGTPLEDHGNDELSLEELNGSVFPSGIQTGRSETYPIGYDEVPASPTSPVSPGGSRLSEKLKGFKLDTASDDVAIPLCTRKVEKLMTASNDVQPKSTSHQTTNTSVPNAATMGSIGAMLASKPSGLTAFKPTGPQDDEAELFALPLSPRSPEMTKSPFSFTAEDTRKYASTTAW